MMLQIDHRESHDVDIFLPDAQLHAFLDPKLHDFEFEIRPSDYVCDGTGFIKLAFAGVGEIDFIVGHALTATPTAKRLIDGEDVDLETISEIITKKIHYRGASIKPRDIFDIAAAAKHDRDPIVSALRAYKGDVARTLLAIEHLNPDFVGATIATPAIKDQFKPIADTAVLAQNCIPNVFLVGALPKPSPPPRTRPDLAHVLGPDPPITLRPLG